MTGGPPARMQPELLHRCPRCASPISPPVTGEVTCSCGAVYSLFDGIPSMMPSQADPRVKSYFDGVADTLHDGKLSYVPFEAPRLDAQLRILAQAFVQALDRWVPGGSTVLDVGCGHGALLEQALPRYRMIGLDFALGMLPLARNRGYAVYHGDAGALPFADDQFDAVVCAELLQHFSDARSLLCEFARVCRPGGVVLISTLHRYSLLRLIVRTLTATLKPASFPLPIIRRSAGDLLAAAAGTPLVPRGVAWVLSPTNLVVFGRRSLHPIAPLATNIILCFQKAPPSVG